MKRASRIFAFVATAALATAAWADDRVVVIPFNVLNVADSQRWIAKGVQENLVADLGRTDGIDPIALNTQVIVEDNATAARLARGVNAPYVIRGSAQVVGNDVRLTAQLIDVRSGDTLRTALVTGTTDDLLKLEDELAKQIRGTSTAAPAVAATGTAPAPATPIILAPPQPQVIVISQPQPYYPSYYPSYSGFGYPYNYFPLVLYQVNPNRNRDHDGDHDGRNPGSGPGRGNGGGGRGGGGGVIVRHDTFDSTGLPIPSGGNLLPIPTGNVLPIPSGSSLLPIPTNSMNLVPTNNGQPVPTRNVQPLPTRNIQPLPTHSVPVMTHIPAPMPVGSAVPIPASAPSAPRTNAGQNRNPRMVN